MNSKIILIVLISHFFGLAHGAANDDVQTTTLGYAEIIDDPRYEEKRAYARIRVKPHYRPIAGAEIAIRESRILGRALKLKFELSRTEADNAQELVEEIRGMNLESGVQFFIIDADAEVLNSIARATAGMEILLFNISEYSDQLRGRKCQAQ